MHRSATILRSVELTSHPSTYSHIRICPHDPLSCYAMPFTYDLQAFFATECGTIGNASRRLPGFSGPVPGPSPMKACLKNSRDRDYIPRLRIGVLSSFRWQCPPAYPNTLFLIDIQLGNPLTRFLSTVRRPSSGRYGGRLSLYGH